MFWSYAKYTVDWTNFINLIHNISKKLDTRRIVSIGLTKYNTINIGSQHHIIDGLDHNNVFMSGDIIIIYYYPIAAHHCGPIFNDVFNKYVETNSSKVIINIFSERYRYVSHDAPVISLPINISGRISAKRFKLHCNIAHNLLIKQIIHDVNNNNKTEAP